MPELKVTNEQERELILSALISHAFKWKEIISLHKETKDALKENAITRTAQKATDELHPALTMIAKYFGVHFGNSKILLFELCSGSRRRA